MGAVSELRLYALGIEELRGLYGAPPGRAEEFREAAARAFAPRPERAPAGLLSRLGPIFKRPPAAPVLSPTQPTRADVDTLLTGTYLPPERMGATWRVVEALAQHLAWGSARLTLTPQLMDEIDFALVRGGAPAALGLRHLLQSGTGMNLLAVQGLTVGWHPHDRARVLAQAYRTAASELEDDDQRAAVSALVEWLDGFGSWTAQAAAVGRPRPDLVGFWAS